MLKYKITSFYKFVKIKNLQSLKAELLNFCNKHNIKGTIIIANEGINSTIAGDEILINNFCTFLQKHTFFKDTKFKISFSDIRPFKKMKVKIKKEIVTFNTNELDMSQKGTYLISKEWDQLIAKEDTIVIDTRNYYEYAMGTFKGAINPHIHHFTELADWLKGTLKEEDKKKNIAMFCTGGIRCEKSTAFLKQLGFEKVYHLKDGILKYLEDNKENPNSTWQGECFVFDDRVKYI
ncbi:rhodanese-related sulfurtransferase [Candidatus Aquarickettsia rohweri]|uniref:tRNA uridine(34) hydroxylase n=1 Tax=Candidatus Aquarickettsia rohweri TaxID=2602574 RepID=A0A429XTA4_9RICK|nr:rhodanese-like domain-containing protein [Candidatus Aquarickettsia rohweri]RST70943.1 hypothetical protein EIC27_01215 [Candidatus Aquarickettsia rohweri]